MKCVELCVHNIMISKIHVEDNIKLCYPIGRAQMWTKTTYKALPVLLRGIDVGSSASFSLSSTLSHVPFCAGT